MRKFLVDARAYRITFIIAVSISVLNNSLNKSRGILGIDSKGRTRGKFSFFKTVP